MELKKKTKKTSFLLKNQGRATIEYLLLGSLLFFLVQYLISPLGENLKDFSGALVGPDGYYACLMKNGLLPAKDTPCSTYLEAVEIAAQGISSDAAQRKAQRNQADSSSSSASESTEQASSSDKTKSKKKPRRFSPLSQGSSSSGSSAAQNFLTSRTPSLIPLSHQKSARRLSEETVSSSKKKKRAGPVHFEFKKSQQRTKPTIRLSGESPRSSGHLGYIILPPPKKEKQRQAFVEVSGKKRVQQGDASIKTQKHLKLAQRKPAEQEAKLPLFSPGNLIKFIFIAILLLALFFLIFSYIMEFKNND